MASAWRRAKEFFTLPGDTPQLVLQKTLTASVLLGVAVVGIVPVVRVSLGVYRFDSIRDYSVLGLSLSSAFTFAIMLATRRHPKVFLNLIPTLGLLVILATDLEAMAEGSRRTWPFVIPLIDVVLVLGLSDKLAFMVAGVMLVWIPLLGLEEEYEFGLCSLFNISYSSSCCDSPPCPRGQEQIRLAIGTLGIILVDIWLTHNFAHGLQTEKAKVEGAIRVAGKTADALANFNLNLAKECLLESDGLPPELTAAFVTLIANLQMYRPYLPDSCFEAEPDSDSEQESLRSGSSSSTSAHVTNHGPRVMAKCVSMMVLKVQRYLERVDEHSLHRFQRKWVVECLKTVRACRGVVDDVNGDLLVAVFNGSRQCVTHSEAALRCAVQLGKNASMGYGIGVGCGKCLCGSIGSDDLRRYTVVGEVVGQVKLLSELANEWSRRVLATEKVVENSKGTVLGKLLVERVVFPPQTTPVCLYEVTGEVQYEYDEWLYRLGGKIPDNPYTAMNQAVAAAHIGDFTTAFAESEACGEEGAAVVSVLSQLNDNERTPVFKVVSFHIAAVGCPQPFLA
eukprot:Sspe_Gene.81433::Locus_52183_Transcript_1_1_Confidence_1.000_Length_1786::g.81433::m.81433